METVRKAVMTMIFSGDSQELFTEWLKVKIEKFLQEAVSEASIIELGLVCECDCHTYINEEAALVAMEGVAMATRNKAYLN